VTGQVDSVVIKRNGNVLWSSAPLAGRLQDCPTAAGTIEYALEANGPGGASRKTAYVTVNQVVNTPTPTPVPTTTPAPQPPLIFSFSVDPTQITTGECVRITWNTGGGTTNVRIVRNGQTLLDNAPLSGTETDCLSTAGTYNYGVEVRNAAGANDFRDQNVTVYDAEPANPLAGTSWILTGGSSPGTVWVMLPGTTISASFSAENQLSGTSGCNTYGATYSVNGSSISIGIPAATNISCGTPEGVMQQEAAYLAALPQMTTYQISGSQLTLSGGSGTLTFQLGAQPY
jgi:heat shock protein HslJ